MNVSKPVYDLTLSVDGAGLVATRTMKTGIPTICADQSGHLFALTVTKGGLKMIANTSDPNGLMDQQNGTNDGRHVESLKNASMADLALILQFHVDRPVVDQSGLKGGTI